MPNGFRDATAEFDMDSGGWLSGNGLKYLIKWHHSGSYQLYPGNVFSE